MGCINTNSKKSTQEDLSNKEVQVANPWKIKCLQPKYSKTAGNEHMRTHDSLAQDHSVEISGHHTFSPHNQNQSIGLFVVKNKGNFKPKDCVLKNSTGKKSNKFLVDLLKYDQTTCEEDKIARCLSGELKEDKNGKKDYEKQDQPIQKVQKVRDSNMKRKEMPIEFKQDKVQQNKNKIQLYIKDPLKDEIAYGQLSAGQIRNKKRPKRAGFRSPRGRSCNLFKTFEDDYIEEDSQPEIRREGQSMGRISN